MPPYSNIGKRFSTLYLRILLLIAFGAQIVHRGLSESHIHVINTQKVIRLIDHNESIDR